MIEHRHYSVSYRSLESNTIQTTELFMAYCGIEKCRPDKSYGPVSRPEWHIHFVRKGEGYIQIQGKILFVQEGQIFALPPNEEVLYYANPDNPWEYAYISFNGTKINHYMKLAGFTPASFIRDAYVSMDQYFELIDNILDSNELTLANDLRRTGYSFSILGLMIETEAGFTKRVSHDYSSDVYVEHALQFIHYNYNEIKVNDIASYIGISRSYLTRLFQQKLDISPQEYLVQYKLKKAEELIRSSTLSIQEIAQRVGYGDPLAFSKIFKHIYGQSPRNYRNLHS